MLRASWIVKSYPCVSAPLSNYPEFLVPVRLAQGDATRLLGVSLLPSAHVLSIFMSCLGPWVINMVTLQIVCCSPGLAEAFPGWPRAIMALMEAPFHVGWHGSQLKSCNHTAWISILARSRPWGNYMTSLDLHWLGCKEIVFIFML